VVGYLCEVFSGQPLDRFLSERIFRPLGMVDTGFQVPANQVHRFGACYQPEGQGYALQDAPSSSPFVAPVTYFSGVGGLVSTTADYLRFAKMLANRGELDGARILGPRTLQLMTMNHMPGGTDVPPTVMGWVGTWLHGYGFGLGFAVLLDPTRSQTLGTPGEYWWEGAASTEFFVSPADDLVAIFMTQVFAANFQHRFDRTLRVGAYQALV
jgi:CubicO group peptidase (beta-lactamase class C family)